MPRQKSGNFDQQQYVKDYYKKNIVRKVLNFNTQIEEDEKLLAWLSKQENFTQYIRALIIEDIQRKTEEKRSS